jgi:diguanylate cyclase (GGDEF)-like protein
VPVVLFIVLVAFVVANLILAWALLGRRGDGDERQGGPWPGSGEPVDLAIELAPDGDNGGSGSGVRPATYDRVIRIVSYVFLLVTAVIVAAGGLWPVEAPAIYLLLIAGAATVFVLHELAPRAAGTGTILLAEGIAAVLFFTLLIVLTGGVASPFFFGYFLIIAAAALVTGGGASLVLAAGITAAYLGVLLVPRGGVPFSTDAVVVMTVNVLALWLLSYLASVVADEQRRTRDAALRLSLHDPLTRLYNRTFLFAVIEREIARAGRTNRRFSLLMLDLDGLKPINDRFGHYFGDRMLQAVADAVRQSIRIIDSPARYGGDEFVVLLPETDTDGAAVVAEKLRRSVAAIRLNAGTELLSTTASIGIVAFPDDGRTADALTNRADQIMYVAKRAGRNRVSVGGAEPALAPAVGTTPSATTAASPPDASTAARSSVTRGPERRPATRRATRPPAAIRVERPYPSMFADRYPTVPRRAPARSSREVVEPPSERSSVSSASTRRDPIVRARRFRIDHSHDRTFDRTMRHFLDGDPSSLPTPDRAPDGASDESA